MFCTRVITHEMPALVRQLNDLDNEVEKFLYQQIAGTTLSDGERVVCALTKVDVDPYGRTEGGMSSRFFVNVTAEVCARALAVGDVVDVLSVKKGLPRDATDGTLSTNAYTASVCNEKVIIRDFPTKCACDGTPSFVQGVRVRLTGYDATNREWTATSQGPFIGFACCVGRERQRERARLASLAEDNELNIRVR